MYYIYDEHKITKEKRIVWEGLSKDKAKQLSNDSNDWFKRVNSPYVSKITQDRDIFN